VQEAAVGVAGYRMGLSWRFHGGQRIGSDGAVTQISSYTDTELPQGTVTFLFTDIQGSTKLLRRLGDDYGRALGTHRELLRATFARHRGREVDTQGDAFFVAFARARDAVAAATDSQRALLAHEWPHGEPVLVRMGIHTGEPLVIDGHYVGMDVHRAARICSAAHGGQIVISESTLRLLDPDSNRGIHFKDLGTHRLKDVEHPERILQVIAEGLPADFPPLRSARPPTNIPRSLAPLIGRIAERAELEGMLLGDAARLVTVTGPGGIGKTRLAATIALGLLDDFNDGVFFVDLGTVQSKDLVGSVIAHALQIPLEADRPVVDAIVDHIGAKQMLLVLDNFEQALEGASVIAQLLHGCPRLTAFVTSRAILSIRGEQEYPLSPLGLPENTTLAAVTRSEAAQMFVERAATARPEFTLTDHNAAAVAEICRLVDGLPLAIELAAARVKLFSPAALLGRLDHRLKLLSGGARDLPVRHRALRTTIDWSYDLLAPDERSFFRDLAVFSGGATLDAIEKIMGDDLDALDMLTTLVNHSLIGQREDSGGEVRFNMLQTIREYALELLDEHPGHVNLRDRHASHYIDVAERAPAGIEADHDNMRAALSWLLQRAEAGLHDKGAQALQLASALGGYWYRHGHAVEGSTWLERALADAVEAPEGVRANALRQLGVLMEQQHRLDRAREVLEEALAYFRDDGNRVEEAKCLNSLGVVARSRQDFDAAQELFETSVSLRRQMGDEEGTSASLVNLGILCTDRGDLDRAQGLLEEALDIDRRLGDDWGAAVTTTNLGVVHLELGDIERARLMVKDAIRGFVEAGDLDGAADGIEALVGVASAEGRLIRSARLAGAAASLRDTLGIPRSPADEARFDRWLAPPRSDLGDDAFEGARAEGAAMTSDQAIQYALEQPASVTRGPRLRSDSEA
jgi:predicted ATPase/class 3 adenylate cyclase